MLGVGFAYPDAITDFAHDVAAGLGDRGAEVAWAWPALRGTGLAEAVRRDRALATAGPADLAGWTALLHWSPVNLGWHGAPLLAARVPAALRRRGARVVTFLHELADEAPASAARRARAAWQVRALDLAARGSHRVVVTADERLDRLRRDAPAAAGRADVVPLWTLVPVSDAPAPPGAPTPPPAAPPPPRLGLLGWNSAGVDPALVTTALRRLRDGGQPASLVLIGRPGRHSEPGERWHAAATAAGVDVTFTGEVALPEVSRWLRSLDAYLHLDGTGALPRRGSFVAALAHGLPVVALRGTVWRRLDPGTEVVEADPTPEAVASTLRDLLADDARRARVGAAARAAYERLLSREAGLGRLEEVLWPG